MKATAVCIVLFAICAAGMVAVTDGDESAAPAATRPVAGGKQMNLELRKALNARGGYVCLQGRLLFLTSNVNRRAQQPGYWFDVGPSPASPALLDKSLPGAWDVAVAGEHAFVCDYTKFLTVWDLRNGRRREVARLPMPSMTENIVIRGKLAYVANHTAGLTIVNIAEPAKPSIVSNINPRIDCDGLALQKDCAVLYGHHESRLVLVDIADPAKPRRIGVYQHDKGSFNQGEVKVAGGFAYCTSLRGLVIVDITDPTRPKLAKAVAMKPVTDVAVKDGFAFVAAGGSGVHVLDVTKPAEAVEVASYADPAHLAASQLAVLPAAPPTRSFYLYVANRRGPALILRFQASGRQETPSPPRGGGQE